MTKLPHHQIPRKPIKRIMKAAGAGRVSVRAIELACDYMVEFCQQITEEAVMLQRHSKRRTLAAKDVALAKRRLL